MTVVSRKAWNIILLITCDKIIKYRKTYNFENFKNTFLYRKMMWNYKCGTILSVYSLRKLSKCIIYLIFYRSQIMFLFPQWFLTGLSTPSTFTRKKWNFVRTHTVTTDIFSGTNCWKTTQIDIETVRLKGLVKYTDLSIVFEHYYCTYNILFIFSTTNANSKKTKSINTYTLHS